MPTNKSDKTNKKTELEQAPFTPTYKSQQMQAVLEAGIKQTGEDAMDVASQGKYTPEKQLVRELMRLLFQGLDLAFIAAGRKAVFTTSDRASGEDKNLPGFQEGARRGSAFITNR